MRPIDVLIAEDEPYTRLGIRAMLERYPDEFKVVAEAVDGEEAVRLADEVQPDLILMDIIMPKLKGLDATRLITAAHPRIYVLILTLVDETESLFTALKYGARGYIVKGADQEEALRAIRAVANGEAVFSPKIAQRLLNFFGKLNYQPEIMPPLSKRETEVLSLLASTTNPEHAVDEIAEQLVLARHTIQNHVSNILVKLQVITKAEAIKIWELWNEKKEKQPADSGEAYRI